MRIKLKLLGVREVSGDSVAAVIDQLPPQVHRHAAAMFNGVTPERLYHARLATSPQEWLEVESDAYLDHQRTACDMLASLSPARGATQSTDAVRALECAVADVLAIDSGEWVAKVTDGGTDIESKATDDVICFVEGDDDDHENAERHGTIFSYLVAAQPRAVREVLDLLAQTHERAERLEGELVAARGETVDPTPTPTPARPPGAYYGHLFADRSTLGHLQSLGVAIAGYDDANAAFIVAVEDPKVLGEVRKFSADYHGELVFRADDAGSRARQDMTPDQLRAELAFYRFMAAGENPDCRIDRERWFAKHRGGSCLRPPHESFFVTGCGELEALLNIQSSSTSSPQQDNSTNPAPS